MTRVVNVGGIPLLFGNFFANVEEADDWLEFDASGSDIEYMAYLYPDHFEEWIRWRVERN